MTTALPQPGDVLLDKYELEWELGRGGYGVVYRGRTLTTGRPVAVKILKPERSAESPRVVERFRREMATVAQLQCPHTMTLYDFGRTDDGAVFMVCEYVEGVDLLDLIVRRGTIKPEYVLDILRQVLLSLSEAHSLGVLHRDIKPANIRVEFPEGQRLRAKVLDFGLAMRLDDQETRLTKEGFVVGTPRYMAPEHLRGEELGPPADIYSLGLVMVEALLGRGSVNVGEPVELRAESGVHPSLRRVLRRMIEPSLDDRYATAAEVLADLPRRLEDGVEDSADDHETHDRAAPETTTTVFKQVDEESTSPHRAKIVAAVLLVVVIVLAAQAVVIMTADEGPRRPPPAPADDPAPVERESGVAAEVTPPADENTCANMPDLRPGVHQVEVSGALSNDRVSVYLPKGYDRSKRHRAILMFPDIDRSGLDTVRMVERQPPNPELEELVVVAALEAGELWITADDQVRRGWARFQSVGDQLCIDTDSAFLLGHGGGSAAVLSGICKLPVLAAATVSYRIHTFNEVCRPPKAPLLTIETTENPYAPLSGGDPCTANLPIGLMSLRETEKTFVAKFGCGKLRSVEHDDGSTCRTSTCKTHYESCVVKGGRDWPGTPPRTDACRSLPGTYKFRDRIWRFFSERAPR